MRPADRVRPTIQVSEGLRSELTLRAHASALLIVTVCALVFPTWVLVDHAMEPALFEEFLVGRALAESVVLTALTLLWRERAAPRRPGALAFVALAAVQVHVAWMLAQVDHVEFYLLASSLALNASGVLLAARPRWTVALVSTTWLALAAGMLTDAEPMSGRMSTAVVLFLSTTSVVALLAHRRRWQLAVREIGARTRLEEEQRRTQELLVRLERLSHEDPLTGLANRRRWDAELAAACARVRETGDRAAVVLLDLDRFKIVNDSFGHAAGDAALQAVATLLRRRVREGDLVARLGGDELAVLLPHADQQAAVRFAERIRTESLALFPEGYDRAGVSLSIGVVEVSGPTADQRTVMVGADAQLYRAKATRNAVRAAEPSLS